MPDTWITDFTHFLEDGRLYPNLHGPARRLAAYLGSIVVAVTSVEPDDPLSVRCRRRPERRPCPGEIDGFIDPESNQIRWVCLVCGDNGLITNWQHTPWDCSKANRQTHH